MADTAASTEPTTIVVLSDLAPDGTTYVATVQAGADTARTLSREGGDAWVSTVLAVAVRAEHDALVMRHLTQVIGSPLQLAAAVVADMRTDRPPLDDAATAPMRLVPGVNSSCEPFIAVHVNGALVGRWTVADARDHAMGVIEVITAVDLDAEYHRFLVDQMDLSPENARAVIHELGEIHDAGRSAT